MQGFDRGRMVWSRIGYRAGAAFVWPCSAPPLALGIASQAGDDTFPSRSIRIIVPTSPSAQVTGRPPLALPALVAAVLAHGDVRHTITTSRYPYDVSLGLVAYGGSHPASNEWRQVLETGRVRMPDELPAEYRATRGQYINAG